MKTEIERNGSVQPKEIEDLRQAIGWDRSQGTYARTLPKHLDHYTVRDADNRLIGYMSVLSDEVADAFLLDLVVHPQHQHSGIGTRIVRKAIRDLKDAGVRCVQVTFADDLEPFYAKCGFHIFKGGIIDFKSMKWDEESTTAWKPSREVRGFRRNVVPRIRIRIGTNSDAKELRRLDAFSADADQIGGKKCYVLRRKGVIEYFVKCRGLFVAEDKEEIIGYILTHPVEWMHGVRRMIWIEHIGTHPAHRRKGVAEALLSFARRRYRTWELVYTPRYIRKTGAPSVFSQRRARRWLTGFWPSRGYEEGTNGMV